MALGLYYFAIAALDINGLKIQLSNIVTFQVEEVVASL
jgi:hypothetical protein